MRRLVVAGVVLLAMAVAAVAARADVASGLRAFEAADYRIALRELGPAAEAGDIRIELVAVVDGPNFVELVAIPVIRAAGAHQGVNYYGTYFSTGPKFEKSCPVPCGAVSRLKAGWPRMRATRLRP